MKFPFILMYLLLSSCSTHRINDPRTVHGVNPAFIPYVNSYLSYKKASLGYEIPIQFAKLEGDVVGLCTRWSTGYRQIEVDEEFWKGAQDLEKFELIAHEMGHCDLNRDHVDETYEDGSPVSIMHPNVFMLYLHNINYYMYELFNPKREHRNPLKADCVKDIEVE